MRVVNTAILGNPLNVAIVSGIVLLTWVAILVVYSHAKSGPMSPDDISKG